MRCEDDSTQLLPDAASDAAVSVWPAWGVPGRAGGGGELSPFLAAIAAHSDCAALRTDALANLLAVAAALYASADWLTDCARPTWRVVAERTTLGQATVGRWLRWLRQRGFLEIVETGSTWKTRGRRADDAHGRANRSAVYRLLAGGRNVPSTQQFVHYQTGSREHIASQPSSSGETYPSPPSHMTPSPSNDQRPAERDDHATSTDCGHPTNRAVDKSDRPTGLGFDLSSSDDLSPLRARAPARGDSDIPPQTSLRPGGKNRREIIDQLLGGDVTLRRAARPTVLGALAEPLAAGASADDLRYMINHRPDGTAWRHEGQIRSIGRWLRWRVAHWRGLELPSAAAARRRSLALGQLAERRAAAATARAAAAQVSVTRGRLADRLAVYATTGAMGRRAGNEGGGSPASRTFGLKPCGGAGILGIEVLEGRGPDAPGPRVSPPRPHVPPQGDAGSSVEHGRRTWDGPAGDPKVCLIREGRCGTGEQTGTRRAISREDLPESTL